MGITRRRANLNDLHLVLSDPSATTAAELAAFQLEPKDVLDDWLPAWFGESAAIPVTFDVDGVPAMVVGHMAMPGDHRSRVFGFWATERYWKAGAAAVRLTKDHAQGLLKAWPGVRFESYTASPHPDVGRWFRALGFKPAGHVAKFELFVLSH